MQHHSMQDMRCLEFVSAQRTKPGIAFSYLAGQPVCYLPPPLRLILCVAALMQHILHGCVQIIRQCI